MGNSVASAAIEKIEALLRQQIGLDPQSVGRANIVQAVRQRLRALGLEQGRGEELPPAPELARYAARLAADAGEFDQLVEVVVVRNSWLFREGAAFAALGRFVAARARPGSKLRLLSLGCASGEEPVSLAVTLLDAGVSSFEVDGVDISEEALRRARAGRFGAGGFPPESHKLRDRYFERSADGEAYVVGAEVAGLLRFHRGNAVDDRLLADHALYDVVFCRNLLVYFDQQARRRTLANIDRLLAPGGLLVVGATEAARLSGTGVGGVPLTLERFEGAATAAFTKPADAAAAADGAVEAPPTAQGAQPARPAPAAGPGGALAPGASSVTRGLAPPAVAARREGRRSPTSGLLPVFADSSSSVCWKQVGVLGGDGSCPELPRVVTCLGCPAYREHGGTLLDRPAPPGYAEAQASIIAEPKDDALADTSSLTVFRLAREWFALPTDQVQLVAPLGPVHTVPFRSGRIFRGITNITGTIYLCASLHGLLRLEALEVAREGRSRMVVIGPAANEWVFEADELDSVTRCDLAGLRPPPVNVSSSQATFTRGVIALGQRQVGLLDGELVVAGLRRAVQ